MSVSPPAELRVRHRRHPRLLSDVGHRYLLQSALVHVNMLLLQEILSEEKWQKRLTDADRRALSPLFRTHVNPCLDEFRGAIGSTSNAP
ncbi:Tn3 family transposase [Streptomyces sp. NPDC048266]|uniref:Tn3 family transposase n=1 Tax=Streptomyces sp. NPDC048266 TaxID=3155787 RepID=UPI0033CB3AC9